MHVSGYLSLFFYRPIGDAQADFLDLIEQLVRLCPPFDGSFLGKSLAVKFVPYRDRFLAALEDRLEKAERASQLGDDHFVNLHLKTGPLDTTEGAYSIEAYGSNSVYIRSQDVYLPNYIKVFFPLEAKDCFFQLQDLVAWLDAAFDRL